MNRNGLQAVLRSVVGAFAQVPDAELLRRYVADRDESAFAELVRRHGRLVWAVCRQLTNCDADADDAFQATFLVLVNGAGKVRDAGKLSAWLHGVAYKVCAKSRRAAKSREGRESASAKGEGGTVVPDSAWDKALAAVHEEVARLPESLRVPFVMCCLDGKCASDAAEQLGWKLGTFSGRLTRAKDAVIARLHARGMTLAALVAVASPRDAPAAAVKKAAALCGRDFVVPGSILKLSQGVIGMSASRVKLLAVGLFVVCGLGVGGRAGWLATAEAQSAPQAKGSTQDKIKQLEEEIARLKQEISRAERPARVTPFTAPTPPTPATPPVAVVKPVQPVPPQPPRVAVPATREVLVDRVVGSEFDYVPASEMTTSKFTTFLRDREAKGWEYKGEATLQHEGKAAPHWVFRKAAKKDVIMLGDAVRAATVADHLLKDKLKATEEVARAKSAATSERAAAEKFADAARALAGRDMKRVEDLKTEQLRALDVELKKLHDLRATVVKPATATTSTVALRNEAATTIAEQMKALAAVGGAKAKSAELTIATDPRLNTVILSGPADAVKWATEVIKSLDSK